MEYFEGICMMCQESPIEVRRIDLYLTGSEGFYCCRTCENKLLEFIQVKRKESTKRKRELFKLKKKGGETCDIFNRRDIGGSPGLHSKSKSR